MTTTDDAGLTLAEVAARVGRSEVSVRRWINTGRIKARKVLNRFRVPREEVDRLLAAPELPAASEESAVPA